jgi:hypothetical protein
VPKPELDDLSNERSEWAKQWVLAEEADCIDCYHKAGGWLRVKMFLCTECGNKRCPKATNHKLKCTGSNEPGQPGSMYE